MGLADDRKPVNLMTVHVSKSVTAHEVSNSKSISGFLINCVNFVFNLFNFVFTCIISIYCNDIKELFVT